MNIDSRQRTEKKTDVRQQRDGMFAELYRTRPEPMAVLANAKGHAACKETAINLFLLASETPAAGSSPVRQCPCGSIPPI